MPRGSMTADGPAAEDGPAEPAAAEGRLDLDLDVVGIGADLEPSRPAPVEEPEAELGEVGQEDVGEVDHQAAALGADAQDRQGHQDRVGVVLLDRLLQRRARRGGEVDVLADQLEVVADPVERQHPLVAEIQRLAGVGRAPGDHHRRQDRLLELLRLDLGVEMLVLLVERDEALVGLRPLGQLVEVLERPPAGRPAERSHRRSHLDRDRRILGRLLGIRLHPPRP